MGNSRLSYPRYQSKTNYRSSTQNQTTPNIHTNLINFMNLYSNFMLIQINQHQSKHNP